MKTFQSNPLAPGLRPRPDGGSVSDLMKASGKSYYLKMLTGMQIAIRMFGNTLTVVSIVLAGPRLLPAQSTPAKSPKIQEQSVFSYELEFAPIQRPAKLSEAALRTLSKDERVASCLENNRLRPDQLPANWFIASGIHLDGPDEQDLIVLPGDRLPDTPPGEPSQNACLVGANTAQFWALRKTQLGFDLVLSQIALELEVLPTKTNGLRDIRLGAVVGGGYADTIDYTFDGRSYEIAKRSSELIGAELPRELSGYETREPLVQLPGQPSDPIRAQARAWIWERWQAHKLSYLQVRTHDDNGNEESSTYFINVSDTADWQVILKVHRTVSAEDSSSRARRKIIEDELLVADRVQRIEQALDDSRPPRVLPEKEEFPGSKYRLQFLDYGNRTVGTL